MSGIKVEDLAYVRFRVPDLDAMEAFLADFGLETAARTDAALYSRAADGQAFCHVAERGEPGFVGLGLRARSADDLAVIAKLADTSVEASSEPGGGRGELRRMWR